MCDVVGRLVPRPSDDGICDDARTPGSFYTLRRSGSPNAGDCLGLRQDCVRIAIGLWIANGAVRFPVERVGLSGSSMV